MARRLGVLAIVAAFGVLAVGATASQTILVTVNTVQNPSLGVKILVSSGGRTLYTAPKSFKCTGTCASQWPPLLLAKGGKAIAGPGVVASKLGSVKLTDGKLQVAYGGKPLFLFAGDKAAGSVKGQGEGGVWHAVAPTGAVVLKSVSTSSTGSTGSKSSGGTSSGSGGTSSGSGGSTGSTGGSTGGSGGTTTTDCDTNPGGYGCM